MFGSPLFVVASSVAEQETTTKLSNVSPIIFLIIHAAFLGSVFFLYPLICKCKINNSSQPPLKGLNLPEGSVRAMIAIAIIGSFLITLSLGPLVFKENDHLNTILAAFGSLSGAVIGFYFGSRSSDQKKTTE